MKKLNKEDLPKLKEFSKKAQYNEYNSNVVTMVMWDHVYEIFYELHHFEKRCKNAAVGVRGVSGE